MFFTVKGPLQPGLSPLPTTFKYTVTTAAGNNLLGSKGTVTLAAAPDTSSTSISSQLQPASTTFKYTVPRRPK